MKRCSEKNGIVIFFCPGCRLNHRVPVNGMQSYNGCSWQWNRSENLPTLQPSLNYNFMDPASHCHSIVTEGRILFLTDCFHALAGHTVDIPEWQ